MESLIKDIINIVKIYMLAIILTFGIFFITGMYDFSMSPTPLVFWRMVSFFLLISNLSCLVYFFRKK